MKVKELMDLIKVLNINSNNSSNKKEDGRYVIVRTYSAGVFAGESAGSYQAEVFRWVKF